MEQDYLLANQNLKHELNGLVSLAMTGLWFLKIFSLL